jgi:cyanophycinase
MNKSPRAVNCHRACWYWLVVGLLLAITYVGVASASDEGAFPWLDPAGYSGTLVLAGSGELSAGAQQQCERLRTAEQARTVNVQPGKLEQDALSGAVVVAISAAESARNRFIHQLTTQPQSVGIELYEKAVLVVRGRKMEVIGEGTVTVILAASSGRPLREIELKPGQQHDWTMLRRAALERSLGDFPPALAPQPHVASGALLIVGGGRLGSEITGKFIELAGGPDAPIVILPIAAGDELPEDASGDTRVLSRAGAKNVRSLRARTRAEIDSPEFARAIKEARGVWFNGGRQWRFVDAYQGTQAEELFRDVLRRGGVIGGSSAGASIQSQYMPRGSPLGNEEMLAEGYERGLGFLPGAAVDQHFSQRRRHRDMTLLMKRYPQLLGIGFDEATALVVRGSKAEIIGRGRAHFYNYREGPPAGERDYMAVSAGQTYDLVQRRITD